MYYHRIISFFLFCGAFFTIALFSALALWVAAGFIYARESDILSEGAVPETESVTSSLDTESQETPILRQRQTSLKAGKEDPTRRQLEDQARRLAHARARGDAFVHSGTDTEAEDEDALAQVQLSGMASEDEAVLVKRESQSTSEESSPKWENVSITGNDTLKKEDSEDVPSVAAQRGEDASTSARLARAQSLRRRASNRSLKVEDSH